MKRLAAMTVACLLLLAGPALADDGQQTTQLLSPAGQPVGGRWQRWLNNSYVPTYDGAMVLDLTMPKGLCGPNPQILACTGPWSNTNDIIPSLFYDPETDVNSQLLATVPDEAHWMLLYEQGHVVDYVYLNDERRIQLLELWHMPLPPIGVAMAQYWFGDGPRQVPAEWFSQAYVTCALRRKLTVPAVEDIEYDAFTSGFPLVLHPRSLNARAMEYETCSLIRTWIGQGPVSQPN